MLIVGGLILFSGAHQMARAERVPYEMFATYKGCQPDLFAEDSGIKRTAAAVALMATNGLTAAIQAKYGVGTEETALRQALAVRESDGQLKQKNGDVAFCAFQIYYTNTQAWYNDRGKTFKTPALYQNALRSDPVLCFEAGDRAFLEAFSAAGRLGYSGDAKLDFALCSYGNEAWIYKKNGACCASDEFKITAARILKRAFSYTISNVSNSKFARKITKDTKTGKILAEEFLCKDHSQEIPLALAKMAQSYQVTRSQAEQEAYFKTLKTYELKKIQIHKSPVDTMCIRTALKKYDGLVDKQTSVWKKFAAELIADLLTQTCNYVSTQAETAFQNLLNLACVPLPNMNFMLGVDLPSLSKVYCDGLSLADVIKKRTVTDDSVNVNYPSGSLPSVEVYPSYGVDSVPTMLPVRRGISTEGGQYEVF